MMLHGKRSKKQLVALFGLILSASLLLVVCPHIVFHAKHNIWLKFQTRFLLLLEVASLGEWSASDEAWARHKAFVQFEFEAETRVADAGVRRGAAICLESNPRPPQCQPYQRMHLGVAVVTGGVGIKTAECNNSPEDVF